MWQEFDPVFLIDIAIFGSSVGPYAVLSTTAVSWIWSFAQVDPSAADEADGVDRAEGEDDPDEDADPEEEEEEEDDDGVEAPVAVAVGSAEVAPLPRPTTISTTTTTMSRSTPMTVARRRQ
jgi:hypothetical protein